MRYPDATLSMRFGFSALLPSVLPPPITHVPAERSWQISLGGQGGGRWQWGMDYGQRACQAHIQPPSSRHPGLLCGTTLHIAHYSAPLSACRPQEP